LVSETFLPALVDVIMSPSNGAPNS